VKFGRVGGGLLAALAWAVLGNPAPASAVTVDWVFIGDPGNPADPNPDTVKCAPSAISPCGSVAHEYAISKYEVTNTQYAEFLNAKAAADPLALYHTNMNASSNGGITRSGVSGSYGYSVKAGMESMPINYVSFWDATRFANWLHNGQGSGDTETGAYTLLGGTPTPSNGATVTRNPGAIVFLPSENEWYKAAYYDPISDVYYAYPTGTDTPTVCSGPTGTAHHANCFTGSYAVAAVGAYPGSASPNGTFDQGGNVAEWNDSVVYGSSRGRRGGSFYGGAGELAADYPVGVAPTLQNDDIGFRVAMIPEPSTGLLVAAGFAGLALRRRSRSSPRTQRSRP
jgi:formylglycine-generating enzyme required for sulfatase activity